MEEWREIAIESGDWSSLQCAVLLFDADFESEQVGEGSALVSVVDELPENVLNCIGVDDVECIEEDIADSVVSDNDVVEGEILYSEEGLDCGEVAAEYSLECVDGNVGFRVESLVLRGDGFDRACGCLADDYLRDVVARGVRDARLEDAVLVAVAIRFHDDALGGIVVFADGGADDGLLIGPLGLIEVHYKESYKECI